MTSPGGFNAQSPPADQVNNFHRFSDRDQSPEAHHHSLGLDVLQAAPGNHTHDGNNSLLIDNRYAPLNHIHEDLREPSLPDHTHPIPAAVPLGFMGEAIQGGAITLAVAGTEYEIEQTRVSVASKPTTRRYKITLHGLFNLAALPVGLYRLRLRALIGQTATVHLLNAQVKVDEVGGTGQQSLMTYHQMSVPANNTVVFSVIAQRANGGSATDTVLVARCLVEDIGPGA